MSTFSFLHTAISILPRVLALQIVTTQTASLQRESKSMSMTRRRVNLGAHQCDWMLREVQKPCEIAPDVWSHNVLVVPFPKIIAIVLANSESADVTRHAEFWHVKVVDIQSF